MASMSASVKRSRGHPPKAADEKAQKEKAVTEANGTEVKRGRGQPPLTSKKAAENANGHSNSHSNGLMEKCTWRLLRYSYKDWNGKAGSFSHTGGLLTLEAQFFENKCATISNDGASLEVFPLDQNVEFGLFGDSVIFLLSSPKFAVKRQLRIRFESIDDATKFRSLLEKSGINLLSSEPQESQFSLCGTMEESQHLRLYREPAAPPNTDQHILQETIRILLQDPHFPEFVVKVEDTLKKLNIIPSFR